MQGATTVRTLFLFFFFLSSWFAIFSLAFCCGFLYHFLSCICFFICRFLFYFFLIFCLSSCFSVFSFHLLSFCLSVSDVLCFAFSLVSFFHFSYLFMLKYFYFFVVSFFLSCILLSVFFCFLFFLVSLWFLFPFVFFPVSQDLIPPKSHLPSSLYTHRPVLSLNLWWLCSPFVIKVHYAHYFQTLVGFIGLVMLYSQ